MKKIQFLTALIFLSNSLAQAGPLQDLIDATPDGGVVVLSGNYAEPVEIRNRDITLYSETNASLEDSYSTPVLTILDSKVTLIGLEFIPGTLTRNFITSDSSELNLENCSIARTITYSIDTTGGSVTIVSCQAKSTTQYPSGWSLRSMTPENVVVTDSNGIGEINLIGNSLTESTIVQNTSVGSLIISNSIWVSIANLRLLESIDIYNADKISLWGVMCDNEATARGYSLSVRGSNELALENSNLEGIFLSSVRKATITDTRSISRPGRNLLCYSPGTSYPSQGLHGLSATDCEEVYVDRYLFEGGQGGLGGYCYNYTFGPVPDAPDGDPIVSENSTIYDNISQTSDFSTQSDWTPASFDVMNYNGIDGSYDESIPAMEIRSEQVNSYGALTRNLRTQVPYDLIRWKYDVSSSVNDGPYMRLRANSPRYNLAYTSTFNGKEDHLVTPKTEPAPFYLYFQGDEVAEMLPSLDLLHSDPNDSPASYFLHHWQSDWMPNQYSVVEGNSYRIEGNNTDWEMIPLTENFTPPAFFNDEAGVGFTAPDGPDTLGFWTLDTRIPITPGYLYQATFKVTSSAADESEAINLPTFRCRVNESGHRKSALVQVTSNALDEIHLLPTAGNSREYTVYLEPSGVEDQTLIVSFDLLHFEESNDGNLALQLESVEIEALELMD